MISRLGHRVPEGANAEPCQPWRYPAGSYVDQVTGRSIELFDHVRDIGAEEAPPFVAGVAWPPPTSAPQWAITALCAAVTAHPTEMFKGNRRFESGSLQRRVGLWRDFIFMGKNRGFPRGFLGCVPGAVGREPQGPPTARQPWVISLSGHIPVPPFPAGTGIRTLGSRTDVGQDGVN